MMTSQQRREQKLKNQKNLKKLGHWIANLVEQVPQAQAPMTFSPSSMLTFNTTWHFDFVRNQFQNAYGAIKTFKE